MYRYYDWRVLGPVLIGLGDIFSQMVLHVIYVQIHLMHPTNINQKKL